MKRILLPLLFLTAVQTGCSYVTSTVNLFNPDPMVDFRRDDQGNTILLDTQKNWDWWAPTMNAYVIDEAAGKPPPGGRKIWDEHWHSILRAVKEGQENYQKYRTYIIHRRWQMGLPPLTEEQ